MATSIKQAYNDVRSGVFRISYLDNVENYIGGGTAFLGHGFLITNFHVFLPSEKFKTVIHSNCDDAKKQRVLEFSPGELKKRLKNYSETNSFDYAVLSVPEISEGKFFEFSFERPGLSAVGTEALILGFPFGMPELVMHKAMVSCRIKSGVADVLLLDASVNPSNSGGPLVDPNTQKVLGIVTRRHTGMSGQYEVLINSINESIATLQSTRAHGGISLMGVDPLHAIEVAMRQIHGFAAELHRSANVGIGYAFEPTGIIEHLGIGAEV